MARRARGEGSAYQRKDGRWVGQIDLGAGRRKYVYGATQQEALRKKADAEAKLRRGGVLAPDQYSVGALLEEWLETIAKPTVRASTYRSYEMHVRVHIAPALGRVRLNKLTSQQVQRWLNERQEGGLSPSSVQRVRATLRRALNQAMRWDLVTRNVSTLATTPKVVQKRVEAITPERAEAILKAVSGHRWEAVYVLALTTGLRQGECLGLQWKQVDLDGRKIEVRHALQRVNGNLILVEPKSERSRRTITLPALTADVLRAHRARQARTRLEAGEFWYASDFVFTTDIGTPLDGPNVTRELSRFLKTAGLPPHRFHDRRHDCATLLLAKGVPMRVVMEVLGHSQIGLTANTYSHVASPQLEDAARAIDEALSRKEAL